MNKKTKSEAGILGAQATHRKRYAILKELAKYYSVVELEWFTKGWRVKQLETLLKAKQR